MRKALLLALLLVGTAQAGAGHDDAPVDTWLWMHHTDEGIAMHPSTPATHQPQATEWEPCNPHTWSAEFQQADPSMGIAASPLARDADTAKSPSSLEWFVERTSPDGEPLDAPWPAMRFDARLVDNAGAPLAMGSVTGQPQVTDAPHIAAFEVSLTWSNDGVIPAAGGLRLEIALGLDQDCRSGWPGLAAHSSDDHVSSLRMGIYSPISIDRIDPLLGEDVRFLLHTSSPWGRADIVQQTPTIVGPTGQRVDADVVETQASNDLVQVWLADLSPINGTYRIDVEAGNAAGTATATASTVFRIGNDATPTPVIEVKEQESPGIGLVASLGAIALALRRR